MERSHVDVFLYNTHVSIFSLCLCCWIRAVFTWLSKGIRFGFGFGFTTPFGWLVYLLWFWFYDSQVKTALTLGRTRLAIAPPWYKGGGGSMETFPRVFVNVALLRKDLTFSGNPSIFSRRWGIFIDDSAAGGLWHHQTRSQSRILPRIRNQVKTARIGNSFLLDV